MKKQCKKSETILLGVHLSIQGGLYKAIDRAYELKCSVLQLFTHNPRQWAVSPVKEDDPVLFQQKRGALLVAGHTSYLINLASGNKEVQEKSISLFSKELERAELFSLPYVILHPGSTGESKEREALQLFTHNLDMAIGKSRNRKTIVLLETTAGQKGSIGYRFEHLRDITGYSSFQEKLGVCFDTCHVFAAGYDIRNEESYNRTMDIFHRIIGIDRLCFFHLNDALNPLGSNKDRHTHIGKGKIGNEAFRLIMNDRRFEGTGKCIETPKGDGTALDRKNLARLRKMVEG
ncbi:MAG: deoxyribonuclease IV [Spirochaetales bacterium]|nr:deoxyribonuclease IV [Spirochaetales bacterium]